MNDSISHFQDSDKVEVEPVNNSLATKLQGIASLSQIIRGFGACAIIASMSLFMLQGWAEGNDITRYLKLLTQTGLLTAAGLLLSFLVKEFKGARVFFGLALISVVANFTILGSLTYSLFALDTLNVVYPASMKWEVIDVAIFLPVFIGALVLLSAVTYFAFRIFSRQIAKPLTLGFLSLSAVLLIPLRAPSLAVGLAALALCVAWVLISRLRKVENLIMSMETKASLGILLLPGMIVLARAVSFYHIDDLTIVVLSGLLLICFRNIASMVSERKKLKCALDFIQIGIAAFMSVLITNVLPVAMNSVDVLIGCTLFIAFIYELVLNNEDKALKQLATNLTVFAIVPIALINAFIDYELIYSAQALIICGLAFALTHQCQTVSSSSLFSHKLAFIGVVLAIGTILFDIVQLAQLGNWLIVGLIGTLLIVGASLYERYGLKFLAK